MIYFIKETVRIDHGMQVRITRATKFKRVHQSQIPACASQSLCLLAAAGAPFLLYWDIYVTMAAPANANLTIPAGV
jgi:hypothetical protein